MTEADAREVVAGIVGDVGVDRLERLVHLVLAENERQNLIARSTVDMIWRRHVLDSVQLLAWADGDGVWLDIGTGGGFPGLVIAAVSPRRVVLVEPRRRRADFLADAAHSLDLATVDVVQRRVETMPAIHASTISARAVSSIDTLLRGALHCSRPTTRWLLPRGANVRQEMEEASQNWVGMFHVEQSLSDPAAGILIASGVEAR